ncbi:MAG: GPW/gp25 family protein [Oscillospiraceae bacterium]
MDKAFLGTSMKFPPQIDPATGRFVASSGAQSVKESIYLILMTNQSERWLVPEFGSKLMQYTFMDISATSINMMVSELRAQITSQEPRISDVNINVTSESRKDCLIVNVRYNVRETNTPDNFVFPFYLTVNGAVDVGEEDYYEG